MKKNTEVRVKMTSEEKEKIKRNAERIGLSLQQYMLKLALNTEVSISIKSRV